MMTKLRRHLPDIVQYVFLSLAAFLSIFPFIWMVIGATNSTSEIIRGKITFGTALFDSAREEGALMSRSAAQQIEHWARMGAALEASGLTVAQAASLLKSQAEAGDAKLWAFKRERQRADLAHARSGRITQDQLCWFSGGKALKLKLINSPY